jgi:uncharacterized membrane protein SpoIIM required for sporulation
VTLKPAEVREMALLYRSAVNDLSRAQSTSEFKHMEPYLNNLVQRCHGRIYEHPPAQWSDVRQFFAVDFPCVFRKNIRFMALSFIMFILGATLAVATVKWAPETETYFMPRAVIAELDRGVLWTDTTQANPSESSFLMTNNIRVAVNAFAFGVVLGVGTLLLMFHNGMFALGGPLAVCLQHGMAGRLLTFIMAHGVIELSTIFIAGGAGMMIGFAMLFPGPQSRWQAMKDKGRESLVLIMGCFPLLVIAGLIEGMVSLNRHVGATPRIAVAVLSAFFLIAYLGFSGREEGIKNDQEVPET